MLQIAPLLLPVVSEQKLSGGCAIILKESNALKLLVTAAIEALFDF